MGNVTPGETPVFHVCQAALMLDFAASCLTSARSVSTPKSELDYELMSLAEEVKLTRKGCDYVSIMENESWER